MTAIGKPTILIGARVLRNLNCKRIQMDEIWSFVRVKQGNMAKAKVASLDAGDVWTWIALDADTKLIASDVRRINPAGSVTRRSPPRAEINPSSKSRRFAAR